MSRFLFFLYRKLLDLLLILLYPLLRVILPAKENHHRLGWHAPSLNQAIWIHAASVGEVNAAKALVQEILDQYPQRDILLTTTSTTGMKTAGQIHERIHTHLLPLDIPILMNRFIRKVNPSILILIETEIWPVMLYRLKRMKVPVLWVNARISDRSYPKYKRMTILWNLIRDEITQVNTQSELDAERFKSLGFQQVVNMHNLKFALKQPEFDRQALRAAWNLPEDAFILVFGSSRPGEESMLHDALPLLQAEIPHLHVILAPRHLNRLPEVQSIFTDIPFSLHSEQRQDSKLIIVDSMGVLVEAYALSDIAVIGGSFYDFGGHNPLEAAYYGLPIIMGEYHSSCRDSVAKLQSAGGICLSNTDEFTKDIITLAKDEPGRIRMGEAAKSVMKQYAHSLEGNLETIRHWLIDKAEYHG